MKLRARKFFRARKKPVVKKAPRPPSFYVRATELTGQERAAVKTCAALLHEKLSGGVYAVTGTLLVPVFPKLAQALFGKLVPDGEASRFSALAAPLIVAGFGVYQYMKANRQITQAFRKAVFQIRQSNNPKLSELVAKSKYLTITHTGLVLGSSHKPRLIGKKTQKLE